MRHGLLVVHTSAPIAGTAFLLLLLQGTSFGDVLHERIPDRPRRRLFVASVSFFLTFAGVRAVVYAVLHHIPPFHFIIQPGGRHIHHLVFGILILLLVGYGWLADIGTGEDDSSILLSRIMSILYGVGAALTLDEFALWLNLRDVYWSPRDAPALTRSFFLEPCWRRAPGALRCFNRIERQRPSEVYFCLSSIHSCRVKSANFSHPYGSEINAFATGRLSADH